MARSCCVASKAIISSPAVFDTTFPCAMMTTPDGVRVIAIAACHCGSIEDGERALAPLKAFGPPVLDQIGVVPYAAFQQALDAPFPDGRRYYWKSAIVPTIPDIRANLESTYADFRGYVASLSDTDLDTRFTGRDGKDRSIGEAVTLLAWHEAHHQGQIHLTWNIYKAANGVK